MSEAPDRELLRAFRSDEATLDPGQRARIDARVGAAIAGELVLEPVESASTAARRAARWRGWAIAGVAMVATVLVAVLFLRGGDETGEVRVMSAPPTAEALVRQVELTPTAVLEPGQWLHQRVMRVGTQAMTGEVAPRVEHVQEYWVDDEGAVRLRSHDEVLVTETGTSLGLPGGSDTFELWANAGYGGFTQPQLDAMPVEAEALEAVVVDQNNFRDDDRGPLLVALADLASLPNAPAAVRAAALERLIELGATYRAEPDDLPAELASRGLVALAATADGSTLKVWVDPTAGVVVGFQSDGTTYTKSFDIVDTPDP